jgi:hypothetical protein
MMVDYRLKTIYRTPNATWVLWESISADIANGSFIYTR